MIEGFFVGVQHPMILILRKSDMKLLSCSRKKCVVYESAYICPLAHSPDDLRRATSKHDDDDDGPAITKESEEDNNKVEKVHGEAELQHVQSIKSMSSHRTPTAPEHNSASVFPSTDCS
jgi:hypothetical protein